MTEQEDDDSVNLLINKEETLSGGLGSGVWGLCQRCVVAGRSATHQVAYRYFQPVERHIITRYKASQQERLLHCGIKR